MFAASNGCQMHSAKCVFAPPGHGNTLGACIDFAAAFLRDDGTFESTTFDRPERMETALREASSAPGHAASSLEESIVVRRDLSLVGKSVDVRGQQDENYLCVSRKRRCHVASRLPQLSALLAALRGTSGCVIVHAAGASLCVGVETQAQRVADDDDDDATLVPAALSTVCYDPTPRPLFKLTGASALRFTSVRGLQLHVIAVLASLGDAAGVRLALLVARSRRDSHVLDRVARDVARLRRSEKLRAIARQRADIEALRDRLCRDKAAPAASLGIDSTLEPPETATDSRGQYPTNGGPSVQQPAASAEPTRNNVRAFARSSLRFSASGSYCGMDAPLTGPRHSVDGESFAAPAPPSSNTDAPRTEATTSEHEAASSSSQDRGAAVNEEALVQAALAAYSSSLCDATGDADASTRSPRAAAEAVERDEHLRASADSTMRELLVRYPCLTGV